MIFDLRSLLRHAHDTQIYDHEKDVELLAAHIAGQLSICLRPEAEIQMCLLLVHQP